ncbi:DNA-3-methyladenine glycosylase [Pedobacter sp. P351]|uniref:DNA-3-methyladenine glycosylase n=1 Tax=Pedobacter superstes TaxID=3133441 RepID=UPI0030B54840
MKLPISFYQSDDVVSLSAKLLGKQLFTHLEGEVTGGIIVETEAYRGPEDLGSHAYNHRRTPRNEVMYTQGGVIYMYICYGIHDMLNIVTGLEGDSHAILIRAIEPMVGLEVMRIRRGIANDDRRLCKGPGALAQALGLKKSHNGTSLISKEIWIEDNPFEIPPEDIIACPRIGLNIAEPYKSIPWRFYIKGNKFISRP